MLVLDPEERWSCKQCLEHHWFQEDEDEMGSHVITSALAELRKYLARRQFKYVLLRRGVVATPNYTRRRWSFSMPLLSEKRKLRADI